MAEKAQLQVLQGYTEFALNLYKILAETEGNIFFSPFGVHAVLSMIYLGALDTTAQQLSSCLQVPESQIVAKAYKAILERLNSMEKVTLSMANNVFPMEGSKLLKDYTTSLTKNFLSEVQFINFGENEAAAKIINKWVEKQTNGKIQDCIDKSSLSASTQLILLNAIYFQGNWDRKFDKEKTVIEQFYLNEKDTVPVDMMHIGEPFRCGYDRTLNAQILEMFYANLDLSMIIILPTEINGINELEQNLRLVHLPDIIDNLNYITVEVSLPRFRIEETINFEDALTKLGLGEIFDGGTANFKGMIDQGNFSVDKIRQKAVIEVNEEGAEASAVTRIEMFMSQEWFNVNHPFIFLIVQKPITAAPLFIGKIMKP